MSPCADDVTEAIAVPTEKKDNVVQIRSSPSPELQRSLVEPSKCTAIEQNQPLEHWENTRHLAGCCEPVQWLFDSWFGSHSN
ncbi:unnamed protein product [Sphagnum balticum]